MAVVLVFQTHGRIGRAGGRLWAVLVAKTRMSKSYATESMDF